MKIGVTTLSNYNYGSVLNYYATQSYISKYYCDCVLIEENPSENHRITLATLMGKCALNPLDVKSIFQCAVAERASSLTISPRSLAEIKRFRTDYFAIESYTREELEHIAATEEYDFFFSGSDQVWNGARVKGYDLYFLRFAPKEKRIAWAPSFGSEEVMRYNQKLYTKYLNEYHMLSVREESGRQIVQKMTGKEVPVLCDPVMLFTGEEWRSEYKDHVQLQLEEPFVVVFFLNEISPTALSFAKELCSSKKLRCISFGYSYPAYEQLDNYQHYDGSPFDFLYVMDHAITVITDSFHATAFSALFHTEFYVFSRNYTHSQDQSTRFTHLLDSIGTAERFNPSVECPSIDFSTTDHFFAEERLKADHYVESCLGMRKKKTERVVLFQNLSSCCGCGACVDACPKNAITMQSTGFPRINLKLCVGCRKCLSVCGLKMNPHHIEFKKKAFIGFGNDAELASKSASGGAFSAMARNVLSHGGVVYGAAMEFPEGRVSCCHVRIDDARDLQKIQNSKYVQSDTSGIFHLVKEDLENGRTVLFSGTSCQVASLRAYLGEKQYNNLVTVDLICHGVPPIGLLRKYVEYIEAITRGHVIDFSFRTKDRTVSSQVPYVISVTTRNGSGEVKQHYFPLRCSAYYRLFMASSGYRDTCYSCKFATIDKPADITLGDYYVRESKSKEISTKDRETDFYSCVITHTQAGEDLLTKTNIRLHEIAVENAVADHSQLQHPSAPTEAGLRMLKIYKKSGFKELQAYIERKNRMIDLAKKVVRR